jgi:hypothetical protein
LASASEDTTILVWSPGDLTAPLSAKLAQRELAECWKQLANPDPAAAWPALWRMQIAPACSLALLQGAIPVVPPPDPRRVQRLLADLDAKVFAVRQKAEEELKGLGELASEAVRLLLQANPSLEVEKRARRILAEQALDTEPERLRLVRAVTVLEQIGSPQARKLLQAWSRGAEGALLTREAKAALHRLNQRR